MNPITPPIQTPTVLAAADPLEHVVPHTLFDLFGVDLFPITNHLLMGTLAAILVLLVFLVVKKNVATGADGAASSHVTRGPFAQLFETICSFLRDTVAKPNLGHLTDRYIPFIWTVFFFILFCNVLGMVPFGYIFGLIAAVFGASNATIETLSHYGGTATSNLSLNIPLALCSLIAVIFIGVREAGKHFFEHFMPVAPKPWPMAFIAIPLVVMEIMSLLIRCGVLAMRLFGTMLAGHLVLAALIGQIFVAAAISSALGVGAGIGVVVLNVLLSLLELFIAFLQAFIFTFLTVLFIAMTAVVHEDEHGHEHAGPTAETGADHPSVEPAAVSVSGSPGASV